MVKIFHFKKNQENKNSQATDPGILSRKDIKKNTIKNVRSSCLKFMLRGKMGTTSVGKL